MADSLISAVKNGDRDAFEKLLKSYEPLIRAESHNFASRFPEYSAETEEFAQEARLALYNAAVKYDETSDVTFGLYAKICVHNRLVSYMRKLRTAKKREQRAADAHMVSGVSESTEELYLALEREGQLSRFMRNEATELEKTVFTLYLQKHSYSEIADATGKSEKSVDNALYRIKTKLKKHLGLN